MALKIKFAARKIRFPVRKIVFAAFMIFVLAGFTLVSGKASDTEHSLPPPPTMLFVETETPSQTTPSEPAVPPMLDVKSGAIAIGNYIYMQDAIAEIYTADENKQLAYAAVISGAYNNMQVKTYLCLVPTPYEFIGTALPDKSKDSQQAAISLIQNNVFKNIICVNVYEDIKTAVQEKTCFRSDTRLSAKAAYGMYTTFAKSAGFTPVPLYSYEEKSLVYYGNLYQSKPIMGLWDNPDVLTFYKPEASYNYSAFFYDKNGGGAWHRRLVVDESFRLVSDSDIYKIFMSGDPALGMIETSVKNGKSILIVSDSTDNAFTPFLLPHYQTIYTIDPTIYKYNISAFIAEQNIQEVLYMNTVISATDPNFVGKLAERAGVDVSALLTAKPKKEKQ